MSTLLLVLEGNPTRQASNRAVALALDEVILSLDNQERISDVLQDPPHSIFQLFQVFSDYYASLSYYFPCFEI